MKVIFVNRYFHPDQSATSRMLSSLAFALSAQGMRVAVVASRQFHDGGERLPAREIRDGVEIHRIAGSGFGRGRLAGRAIDYLTFHSSAAGWLAAHARRGDVCVICTDPPFLSVSASLALSLRKATMVNWVMDLFPETAIELGMLPRRSAGARISAALRDWSYRRAALNVCPIGRMERYMRGRGIPRERLCVLPHWSDGSEIFPVAREHNPLRREWGLEGKFVVGYSGNFGRAHEFDTLLDAAERLKDQDDIRFLLVGDGQKRGHVEDEVRRRGLGNVVLKPLQPLEHLAESLGAADLHFVSLLPRLEHCIIPSKFYGILAAGRPTLFAGHPNGEIARVVTAEQCGASVAIGQSAEAANYIVSLRDRPDRHAIACANARRLFETHHARDQGVAAWRELLAAMEAQRTPPAGALRVESAVQ